MNIAMPKVTQARAMCGNADETPAPPPQRVVLSNVEQPSQTRPRTSTRPYTSTRPSTSTRKDRPHSSAAGHDRPQSTRPRPSSSSVKSSRPSSSKRALKTSGGERHTSSHRDRSGSQFPSIPEYPEDRTIIRLVTNLTTLVDQHAEFYYPHDVRRTQGEPTLDNLETRHAAIRRYIAREIIESIIEQSSSDTSAIANDISNQLATYADPNINDAREAHIQELCNLGDELRGLMESHPSTWTFGSWEDNKLGFIVMIPAFLKDGEQVVPRQIFRTG